MFVEFSVQNFRSIKDIQTLSFAATGLRSPKEYADVDTNNIAEDGGRKLLKTVGIYGPNASGKSNIIRAMEYFLTAIYQEPSSKSNLRNLCDPFLYQENAFDTESFFQIVFMLNDKKYRYGFTVKRNINAKENESKEIITNEWLFGVKEKNSTEIFSKKLRIIEKDKLPKKEKIPPLPYEHTLFLTHAAAFDKGGICMDIKIYLGSRTASNFGNRTTNFLFNSISYIENELNKEEFLRFLSAFSLNYDDVGLEKDPNKPIEEQNQDRIFLYKYYHKAKVQLNLAHNELSGTQKLFEIAGLLLRVFNMNIAGGLIIFDEIDDNFHPSLLIKIIQLFNDPAVNKSNCQLLFTNHDTNLLSPKIMRRDQFYFAEKNEDESTRLYSLADLKRIRNDADFARQYLAGFYGAVPDQHNFLIQEHLTQKSE